MNTTTKKTKIVATIGPVTTSQEVLEKLLKAGLNVMRFNFSHGDFSEHQEKVDNGRKASKATGIPVSMFQDLGGPKIRTGEFNTENGRVTIKKGAKVVLTTEKMIGDENRFHINYEKLPEEAKVGHVIMLDDGKKRLRITDIKGTEITCKVEVGGELKGRRGVNLPDTDLSISAMTPKDKKDVKFAIDNKLDYVALSFVRRPSDVTELRNILKKAKSNAGIISKIETPQAVTNIDEIIELSDAIMVARGDLAVEVPAENVPLIQKMIVEKCNRAGKPVIVATQVLESMIKSPVPTRAEVADIANAVLDGTDALMLSEETTLGDFPIESVETMARVAHRVENDLLHAKLLGSADRIVSDSIGESTVASAVKLAREIKAKCLVSFTNSGYSARMLARHRHQLPTVVFTPNKETYGKLVLCFGCEVHLAPTLKSLDDAMEYIRKQVKELGYAKKGDRIVVASALPFGVGAETNVAVVETI